MLVALCGSVDEREWVGDLVALPATRIGVVEVVSARVELVPSGRVGSDGVVRRSGLDSCGMPLVVGALQVLEALLTRDPLSREMYAGESVTTNRNGSGRRRSTPPVLQQHQL